MAGLSPAARRRSAGGLLPTWNFGLFCVGESVSGLGSAITTVALPLVAVNLATAPLACGLDPGALP